MYPLLFKVMNLSIIASALIVIVIVLRLILRKAPKWVISVMWGIVAIRLICPTSIESKFGLIGEIDFFLVQVCLSRRPKIPVLLELCRESHRTI